jgi:hypothetical protein
MSADAADQHKEPAVGTEVAGGERARAAGTGRQQPPEGLAASQHGPAAAPRRRAAWLFSWLPPSARLGVPVFAVSLVLFLVRFLVPGPVGQADNRDGPRLMCNMGLAPASPLRHHRYFDYAYFDYAPNGAACARSHLYPSSELVPLHLAKVLTPVFGLPGVVNLIALGVIFCVIASAGIAFLAVGLRMRPWAQLLVAAAAWVIVADAAFFDVFASPFSEPAALLGLLLIAAGVLYMGRGGRAGVLGLVLAGGGGFLAILSKEQYLILAAPVCLTLILASADRRRGGGLRRFLTRQTAAATAVAAILALLAAGYLGWDYTSRYGARLHQIQAVDMIFTDIVTTRANAPAGLRALGLPASWAKYAGRYYWDTGSVRSDPLYSRYEGKLGTGNIAHYLLTHPGVTIRIGQQAADFAQVYRVTALGDYPPSAGHPPHASESRVIVVTWLMKQLPKSGLLLYLPLWAAMTTVGIFALRRRRGKPWHRDGAALVLSMVGCAVAAFIPPAFFAGISTTRHMVGMNFATALAFVVSVALTGSMIRQAVTARLDRPAPVTTPAILEPPRSSPSRA